MSTLPSTVVSDKPSPVVFTVPCSHHDAHRWAWCDLQATPQTLAELRKWARVQMQTLCPAIGDVLAWEGIRAGEPYDGINWTLRRGGHDLDPGEVAVAIAVV